MSIPSKIVRPAVKLARGVPVKPARLLRTDKGATSQVSIYKDIAIKRVRLYHEFNIFEREVYWLTYLNEKNYDWVPRLINNNPKTKTITMKYCGEKLTKTNAPKNWREQLTKILTDLKKENIKHNDIKNSELLVNNCHLTLIDYGWASIDNDWSCGGKFSSKAKPAHGFFDHTAIERIEKKLV